MLTSGLLRGPVDREVSSPVVDSEKGKLLDGFGVTVACSVCYMCHSAVGRIIMTEKSRSNFGVNSLINR